MITDLGNHLWQSTAFVAVAALVAFALRNNGAHVRHVVWLIASVKFLVPFSLVSGAGAVISGWLATETTSVAAAAPVAGTAREISVAIDRFAQPFTPGVVEAIVPVSGSAGSSLLVSGLLVVWAMGLLAVVVMRIRGWRRVRAAVRASVPLPLPGPYPVRSAPGLLEPGVVGLWRPVLLLPAGIEHHLSAAQLRAVLEHEFTHIRRRDNLTSAMHMVVEAVCWFHPLVWWVGARLVDERERACDEQVLRACGEPETYAEGILTVCKRYVESPLPCVAGVSGSDLKKRITAIMAGRVGANLTAVQQLALALVAACVLSAPLLAGMAGGAQESAQTGARFEAVTVKPCDNDNPPNVFGATRPGFRSVAAPYHAMVSPGHAYWSCATLAQLIPQAFTSTAQPLLNTATGFRREDDFQPTYVKGGPSWTTSDRFTIEAKVPLEVTSEFLGNSPSRTSAVPTSLAMSQALRDVLEDRFGLKVSRVTEQRDMYALTIAPGGINKARITTPVPGDCETVEAYAARAANAPPRPPSQSIQESLASAPRLCGRAFSTMTGTEYYSMTFGQLAAQLSSQLDYVVWDRTGTDDLFNFAIELGQTTGTRDERFARVLADMGLTLAVVKGPAEHLRIDAVQRLRPDSR